MMQQKQTLEQRAQAFKIKIHEPFAQFLNASQELVDFDISLLDCYRLAGHACLSITGAYLSTAAAIDIIYPETKRCLRGDLKVEFGAEINEHATGPRSNVVGYITGAWGEAGFPGLKGQFKRDHLITFGHKDLAKRAIRFRSASNEKIVVVEFIPSKVIEMQPHGLDFPNSWRAEISMVLENPANAINIIQETNSCSSGNNPNGCC